MSTIQSLLGDEAESLLTHQCQTISKDQLYLPGPNFIGRVMGQSDRKASVLRNMQTICNQGRLAGTGYLSLLPVDQGVEHSGGASFAPNPIYFDPEKIIELAIEGGCNGVASTYGVLASVSNRYAHKIPFIMKINHNEILSYPNIYDQTLFASVERAFDIGADAVGAAVYFAAHESRRQIQEVIDAFARA
ncbi:MAG: fructose-bisphosphate aldolase, partial [Zetaproteobacteria bacterium]|nr:fructose-bisphosphate aldolase [Zetaproteobacteria bacterium]